MLLFSSLRYSLGGLFAGVGSSCTVLHFSHDFLKPTFLIKGSLTGDNEDDFAEYWYLSTVRKASSNVGLNLAKYPVADIGSKDQKQDQKQDQKWTDLIRIECKKYKNRFNYFFNSEDMEKVREWCVLENSFVNENMLKIFK